MASIRADGYGVPITLPVDDTGKVVVQERLLSAKFKFCPSTMYIELELHSESGELFETVLQPKCRDDEGGLWTLGVGTYKVFGLTSSQLQASTIC